MDQSLKEGIREVERGTTDSRFFQQVLQRWLRRQAHSSKGVHEGKPIKPRGLVIMAPPPGASSVVSGEARYEFPPLVCNREKGAAPAGQPPRRPGNMSELSVPLKCGMRAHGFGRAAAGLGAANGQVAKSLRKAHSSSVQAARIFSPLAFDASEGSPRVPVGDRSEKSL